VRFKVHKRPFVGDFCSSAGGVGNGVVGVMSPHSMTTVPPFAVRFAEARPPAAPCC
jgi:hypothetical protein